MRTEGDWEGWLDYFLDGVATIADEAVCSARELFGLIAEDRIGVLEHAGTSVAALRLFELLPRHPIVSISYAIRQLGVSKPTAGRAVDALESKEKTQRAINIRAYPSNGRVFVEIEDNGCGIPEEIKSYIFDPFFTTKSPDRGTGLGMPIVESILHKHHARIWMESEVGVGTKFTLVFPAPPPGTMPNPSNPARQEANGKETS